MFSKNNIQQTPLLKLGTKGAFPKGSALMKNYFVPIS